MDAIGTHVDETHRLPSASILPSARLVDVVRFRTRGRGSLDRRHRRRFLSRVGTCTISSWFRLSAGFVSIPSGPWTEGSTIEGALAAIQNARARGSDARRTRRRWTRRRTRGPRVREGGRRSGTSGRASFGSTSRWTTWTSRSCLFATWILADGCVDKASRGPVPPASATSAGTCASAIRT